MTDGVPQIYGALAAIMAEIKSVPKSGYNSHFKYHYTKADDVFTAVRLIMAKHGVVVLPSVVGTPQRRGDTLEVTIEYRFTAPDGSAHVVTLTSEGQDKGDKAYYKAYTAGLKYALMMVFLIGSDDGGDPEHDSSEPVSKPAQRQQAAPSPERQSLMSGLKKAYDAARAINSDIPALTKQSVDSMSDSELAARTSYYQDMLKGK